MSKVKIAIQLRLDWHDLLKKLAADTASAEVYTTIFKDIVEAYSEPIRSYHNLQHIQEILALLAQVKTKTNDFNSLRLAAWFHDYVYNPQADDNEAQSAACAEKVMQKLALDREVRSRVTQIILSTKKHQPLLTNSDNLIFLDLDLGILGATASRYQAYAQAIRQEYQHLSDRNYQQGRKQVLSQFISKSQIYYTDYFFQKFELSARENIRLELNNLDSN